VSSDGALDLFLRAKRLYQPKMLFETVFAGDAELNAALVAVAREVAPDLYTEHEPHAYSIELCAGDDDREVELLAAFFDALTPATRRTALARLRGDVERLRAQTRWRSDESRAGRWLVQHPIELDIDGYERALATAERAA